MVARASAGPGGRRRRRAQRRARRRVRRRSACRDSHPAGAVQAAQGLRPRPARGAQPGRQGRRPVGPRDRRHHDRSWKGRCMSTTTRPTTDAPTLEEFMDGARAWLAANAELRPERVERVWGEGSDSVADLPQPDVRGRAGAARRGSRLAPAQGRRRLRLDRLGARARRPRAAARLRPGLRPRGGPLRHADRARGDGHHAGADRADDPGVGHARADGALPHAAAAHGRHVVPAVLRARRRVRPGPAVDARRARRRRVGHRRPEGVDLRGPPRRLRLHHLPHRSRRAQARRADRVPRPDACTRRRCAPAAPDERRGVVQRGVLRLGARRRRHAPRRRR